MQIQTIGATRTMSTREIAELTEKEHKHVLRDVRVMLNSIKNEDAKLNFSINFDKRGYANEYILSAQLAELLLNKYKGLARVPMRLQEEAALKTIEQILGVQLVRQFKCLSYRIDGYDAENNVAYEIDEPAHSSKQENDSERQKNIAAAIGCKFVRIFL